MKDPLIPITRRQALLFALFLVIFEFSTYISNDMIMPAMIAVTQSFHVSVDYVPLAMTAFILGGACWQLILGPVSDRFGRRRVMLAGALLFVLTTLGSSFAANIHQFIWGRFIQGAGLCFVFVIGYATLQEIFHEKQAIQLIALMANVAMVAPLIGPVAGAWYIHYAPWPGIFWIIAGIALVGLVGLWRFMPETVGVVRLDGTVTEPQPLKLGRTLCNYAKLCSDKVFMLGIASMAFIAFIILIWIALSPLMLIDYAKLTTIEYGWLQVPVVGAVIMGNLILRYLTEKLTLIKIVLISAVCIAIGVLTCFIWVAVQHGFYLGIVVGVSIYCLGLGIGNGVLYRQTLFANTTSKGTVSAVISVASMLGFSLAIELSRRVYHANNLHLATLFLIMAAMYLLIVWRFQVGLQKRQALT